MGYELIETIQVGAGGAASIEFTSIPQDGVDLLLVGSARMTTGDSQNYIYLNDDSGSNYANVQLRGTGSASETFLSSSQTKIEILVCRSSDTANTFGSSELYISNYTSSANKSISANYVTENNGSTAFQVIQAFSYATSSAISSIQVDPRGAGLHAEFTTYSLYKITAD